jgi:serine protease AprX
MSGRFHSMLFWTCFATMTMAQTAPNTYWVQFTNKAATPYSLSDPSAFLGPRAMVRRQRQGILLDTLDLPVDPAYVSSVLQIGNVQLVNRSRWMNAITVRTVDTTFLDQVSALPFVAQAKSAARPLPKGFSSEKFGWQEKAGVAGYFEGKYGAALGQVAMMNGHLLHEAGAEGQGMLIGVLDSGFDGVDSLLPFADLRARGGIVHTQDMAFQNASVYQDNWHGRSVLGCMAGHIPGQLRGTAPEANYVLLRTEVADNEYIWEEDNWIAGAEVADSIGCDVLNTSLGYSLFDDSTMDHTYADMNGASTRISIAAGIAAQKGMVPVNSAGNSGGSSWGYITAAADAFNILAVGAVGADRKYAGFSSRGPSADGRVKPDVAAQGYQTAGLGADGAMGTINGTSFSAPLVAGLVACLWQLHPERTNLEIMDAVRQSASQHNAPDDELGYGIPDMWRAHLLLGGTDITDLATDQTYAIWPMPFTDHLQVEAFGQSGSNLVLHLIDPSGRVVWTNSLAIPQATYQRLRLEGAALSSISPGAYALHLRLGEHKRVQSVVKVRP